MPKAKKIAVIGGSYIRDAQVYTEDPSVIDDEDGFVDLKYPCHYVGIFAGVDDDEIKSQAAAHAGVHSGVISLYDMSLSPSKVYDDGGLTRCSMCTAIIECAEGGDMPVVCPECTRVLDYSVYKPISPARRCKKCGSERFIARQVCHHDVVTNGDGQYLESIEVYHGNAPFGPFTCKKCGFEYDDLPPVVTDLSSAYGFTYHKGTRNKREYVKASFEGEKGLDWFEFSVQELCDGPITIHTERGVLSPPVYVRLELLRFVKQEREKLLAAYPVKTMAGWTESGISNFGDYCKPDEEVDRPLVDYFLGSVPPASHRSDYIQNGDPYSSAHDENNVLQPTYFTFSSASGVWRFCGACLLGQTESKYIWNRVESAITDLEQHI